VVRGDEVSEVQRELLHTMPVFGGISEDTLDFLLQLADLRHFSAGEYFFHEGDNAASMFVVQSGRVAVLKSGEGKELMLKELNEGDCFGEMALLDLYPRSCSVKALNACTVIEISQQYLFRLYQHNLEQFTIIQMNIGREISRRLRLTGEQLFQSEGVKIE